MSTNIITGWLNDDNGEKFAPKTLSTQVLMSDGNNLENKIKNIGGSTEITIIKDGEETILNGMRINQFDTKDEYETALENGEIADNEFCSFPDEYDTTLNKTSTNAIQNATVANAIEWKSHTSVTGSGTINLPTNYNELYIEIYCHDAYFTFNIPKIALATSEKKYKQGCSITVSTSLYSIEIIMFLSLSTYRLQSAAANNASTTKTDLLSSSISNIYYR